MSAADERRLTALERQNRELIEVEMPTIPSRQTSSNMALKQEQILQLQQQSERQQQRIAELLSFETELEALRQQVAATGAPERHQHMLAQLQHAEAVAADQAARREVAGRAASAQAKQLEDRVKETMEQLMRARAELELTKKSLAREKMWTVFTKGERDALSEIVFSNSSSSDHAAFAQRYKVLEEEIRSKLNEIDALSNPAPAFAPTPAVPAVPVPAPAAAGSGSTASAMEVLSSDAGPSLRVLHLVDNPVQWCVPA
jgi:hypothetical protein